MDLSTSPLNTKQALLLLLMVVHFSLILFKTFREYPGFEKVISEVPAIQTTAEFYTQMAVLQADYSFFSPNISPDFEVFIEMKGAEGDYYPAAFHFSNTEVEKRFHTCVLALQYLDAELQDIVVKSWAARALERHPEAHYVRVRIERSKLPAMKAYAEGERPEKEKIMEVVFETELATSDS